MPSTSSRSGRKGQTRKQQDTMGSALSAVGSVLNAPINSVVAWAFVLFAAGSVASGALAAAPELTLVDAGTPVAHYNAAQVLGASTVVINDAALEAADPTGAISAKPAGFDSSVGRWDYTISYKVANVTNPATLTIGTYVVKDGITGSGNVETGAILKPNMVYHVALWSTDTSGTKVPLARTEIHTGASKKNSTNPFPCISNQGTNGGAASSTTGSMPSMCVKGDDGKMHCTPACMPLLNTTNASSTWQTQGGDKKGPQGGQQGGPQDVGGWQVPPQQNPR